MATTGFATGEATPAWTTQRVAYGYWVNCQSFTSTPCWTPPAAVAGEGLISQGRGGCAPYAPGVGSMMIVR